MVLQNLMLDDEKVHYDWIKPFDAIAESVHSTDWLRGDELTRNLSVRELKLNINIS